jgi:hypothetical protein
MSTICMIEQYATAFGCVSFKVPPVSRAGVAIEQAVVAELPILRMRIFALLPVIASDCRRIDAPLGVARCICIAQ